MRTLHNLSFISVPDLFGNVSVKSPQKTENGVKYNTLSFSELERAEHHAYVQDTLFIISKLEGWYTNLEYQLRYVFHADKPLREKMRPIIQKIKDDLMSGLRTFTTYPVEAWENADLIHNELLKAKPAKETTQAFTQWLALTTLVKRYVDVHQPKTEAV